MIFNVPALAIAAVCSTITAVSAAPVAPAAAKKGVVPAAAPTVLEINTLPNAATANSNATTEGVQAILSIYATRNSDWWGWDVTSRDFPFSGDVGKDIQACGSWVNSINLRFFTWSGETGRCYAKSPKKTMSAPNGIVFRNKDHQWWNGYMDGYDFPYDFDLRAIPNQNQADCMYRCLEDGGCHIGVSVNNQCYLKGPKVGFSDKYWAGILRY